MIIVNFATKEYARAQQRLKNSLQGHHYLMFDDYAKIGSPSHSDSPYEFKLHAIRAALEIDPIILWCDASMWRVGDLSIIENIIKEDGYFLTESGHYVGRWTNHFTLNHFKVLAHECRQETGGMIMFSAGFIGFNKNSEIAMDFLNQWEQAAKAGCFRGSHDNHRHDQSAGSIIAQRMGMKYQRGGKYMSYIGPGYSQPEAESIFYLQGL